MGSNHSDDQRGVRATIAEVSRGGTMLVIPLRQDRQPCGSRNINLQVLC
jgi:hypothetical protein